MTDFYVYLHKKKTNGDVFYVGKGKGRRKDYFHNRSKYWKNVAKKHGVIVEVYQSGIQEWYALELEKDVILKFGLDKLTNLTEGGEGLSGFVFSEDHKKKISESSKGKTIKQSTRDLISKKNKNRKHTEESKKKISQASLNRTKETTEKRINSLSKPVLCSNGMTFRNTRFAEEWLRNNVNPKANQNKITECRNGQRKSAYGFKWFYL
jgi:hypothetical protein